MLNNLIRHTGEGQYPDKLKFNAVIIYNQAKQAPCLDSGLRQNDELKKND